MGAYFHAADSYLCDLDAVQQGYVKQLRLSAEEAFLEYNFVPLRARRCIGMLGLLHKCVLGQEHHWRSSSHKPMRGPRCTGLARPFISIRGKL